MPSINRLMIVKHTHYHLIFNKKGKKMSNYKYVKRYEQTQQERGLTRQRAWIPNTETAKKALLKYATALREDFLDNQERDNA
jgi:hypothetical protein